MRWRESDLKFSHHFDESKLEWIPEMKNEEELKKEDIKNDPKKVPTMNKKPPTL